MPSWLFDRFNVISTGGMNEAIAENAWPIGPFDLQESGIATASRHGACAVAAASHGTVLRGAEPSRTRVG